ncbi:MAG: hydantoinase/oxoprolinase family protein [Bryobacteraceae bacterium]|nr:hydantoinase/oxoprolinase family protein [Bryobacteraceae bacterium]
MRTLRIGVDAGGTFTDFAVLRADGRVESFKIRSDPRNPARVILEGIRRAAGDEPVEVIHGSTVATNALLERKGARTVFVTTEGFEELIRIGRQNRRRLYDLTPELKEGLVAAADCLGLAERTHFDGAIALRPSADALKRLREAVKRRRGASVAICLLHSYRNAANEKLAADALKDAGYVCCSHEVSPEFREFERASTTVVNAYVGPLMDAYLGELDRAGSGRLSILQSNGGFMSAREARRHAVRTVLSGPAGGVVGAVEMAKASGYSRVLGFDMGGTSTDVSLAEGRPRETTEASVDGFPIRVPMLDIHTVGAGGGSIARVDEGGLLRVGPESAGADPGPACYGVGEEPTVTDAHVVLGRIAARQFLGGAMDIDPERSLRAVRKIGARLGLSEVAAAQGILRVADANMQRAIRTVSVERGHDPREFALAAFGGCGGLHACALAEELGIRTVIVPRHAGALSALGMLMADRVRDYAAGALGRTDLARLFRELERRALRESPEAELERFADARYAGQSYELTIGWDEAALADRFHREHARVYGYANPKKPVEIVTLRVRARTAVSKPKLKGPEEGPTQDGPRERRRVHVGGRWRILSAYRREEVTFHAANGPALVVDYGATTLALESWTLRRDGTGNLVLTRRSGRPS